MDNVKLILFLIVLLVDVVACSKNREPSVQDDVNCKTYTSAYMVEFPDNSLRKSNVADCGGLFKATDLDQGSATIEATALVIQLKDPVTGIPYLTTFAGQ